MKFSTEVVGETSINVSDTIVKVSIFRNKEGNLELLGLENPEAFPEGVTIDIFNNELIVSKFNKLFRMNLN